MSPMTIKIDNVEYVRADLQELQKTGPEVIIRTFSAGVHIGTIKSKEGQEVVLTNARRLWKWSGAFTLNEVATKGINRKESRISCNVPEITLAWIEIIPVVEGVDLSTVNDK